MTKSGRLELKGKPREKAKKCVGGGNEGRGREGIERDRQEKEPLYRQTEKARADRDGREG